MPKQGSGMLGPTVVFCRKVEGMLDWLGSQPFFRFPGLCEDKKKQRALMAEVVVQGYDSARMLLELGGVDSSKQ
jgi:hypothetical protein